MTSTLRTTLAGGGLAVLLALVSSLSVPATTAAFQTFGESLSPGQRHFRVFNNFSDATANNNTLPHPNFPGQTGAVLAIWKAHAEWASEARAGNGQGDESAGNTVLGNGGANFDNTFQGSTTDAGGSNDNVHSELPGSDGGTLAFTVIPITNGWTIKYYSKWVWQDGPGAVSSGIDLQAVACHEIGHSLGLDHSSDSAATMFASISGAGTSKRSIEADDIAGIQSIYGLKSASKPHISALGGSKQIGHALTITGTGFSPGAGEVWFTRIDSNGDPLKVTGVSSSGGGTLIEVTIPAGVQDGEVLVKTSGSGHASLSNAFPISLATGEAVEIPSGSYAGSLSGKLQTCSEGGNASLKGSSLLVVNPQVESNFSATSTTATHKSGQPCDLAFMFDGQIDASGNLSGSLHHTLTCNDAVASSGSGTFTGTFSPGKLKLSLGGLDTAALGEMCALSGKFSVKGPPGPFACDSKRLSLAAKALKSSLGCHASWLKQATSVTAGATLAACVQVSLDAFQSQADAAGLKALAKGGTCTAGNSPAVAAMLESGVQALVDAVTAGFDPADAADSKLRSELITLAGKAGSAALKAQSKYSKKPDAFKLQVALVKAREELISKATKALDKAAAGGLIYSGAGADQLADQLDLLVEQLVELLS